MACLNNYVVYAFVSEDTGLFYYIGKGRPGRPYRNQNRKVSIPRCRSNIIILHRNLDEETAYAYEKKLIAFYGREDLGEGWCTLKNKTNGGSGFSGIRQTPEWKEEKSRKMRGKNNHNYNPFDWFHSICGKVNNVTASELSRMYPEQNLVIDHLRRVSYMKKRKYKGWIIPDHVEEWEKKDPDGKLSSPTPGCNLFGVGVRRINWFHPICGEIRDKTSRELSELFWEQNLEIKSLRRVANGTKSGYKGWSICL
jgi:hypothetical protein